MACLFYFDNKLLWNPGHRRLGLWNVQGLFHTWKFYCRWRARGGSCGLCKVHTHPLTILVALSPSMCIGTVKSGFRLVHFPVCLIELLFNIAITASPRYPHRNTDIILCYIGF